MNDELERTYKETVVAQTIYYSAMFLELLGKTTNIFSQSGRPISKESTFGIMFHNVKKSIYGLNLRTVL
jgi:hypothetical protein